jgi:hypothetical protein
VTKRPIPQASALTCGLLSASGLQLLPYEDRHRR